MAYFLDVPDQVSSPLLSGIAPEDGEHVEIQELINTAMAMSTDTTGKSKPVTPSKGLCVKFRKLSDSSVKFFVNICHTDQIPAPVEVAEQELTKILESSDPTSYKIPLSLGLPHEEPDKEGNTCTAFDVILNSNFFARIVKSDLFKTFVILLAAQGVEDKYSVDLSRDDYVILQNKKYHGKMPEHYIQDRGTQQPAPLIEVAEMAATSSPSMTKTSTVKLRLNRVQKPGENREHLIAELRLTAATALNDLILELATDRIVVKKSSSGTTEVDVCLPLQMDVEAAKAVLDHKARLLTLNVPVLMYN